MNIIKQISLSYHIMGIVKMKEHPYTSPARIVGDHLIYGNE